MSQRFRGTLKQLFTKVRVKPRINQSRRQNSKSSKDEKNVLAFEKVEKNECLVVLPCEGTLGLCKHSITALSAPEQQNSKYK